MTPIPDFALSRHRHAATLTQVTELARELSKLEYERGELLEMIEDNKIMNRGKDAAAYEKLNAHLQTQLATNIRSIERLTRRLAKVNA